MPSSPSPDSTAGDDPTDAVSPGGESGELAGPGDDERRSPDWPAEEDEPDVEPFAREAPHEGGTRGHGYGYE